MAERAMRVGLVGLGTIGTGVVRALQAHGALVAERLGFPLELTRIADVDLERDRGVPLDAYRLSRDWREIVNDPEIDLVVELIGGTRVARELVLAALDAGKHVVTANKALLAKHGREVFALAASKGTEIAFEASVGGTNCANSRIPSFSLWSRTAAGRLNTRAPSRSACASSQLAVRYSRSKGGSLRLSTASNDASAASLGSWA